ncbi:glutamate-rich protein 5 [Rhynchocyon petersi]
MGCSSSALNRTSDNSKCRSGETGEKVEMDVENEKVIEGAETKEEETGESVDPSAAT